MTAAAYRTPHLQAWRIQGKPAIICGACNMYCLQGLQQDHVAHSCASKCRTQESRVARVCCTPLTNHDDNSHCHPDRNAFNPLALLPLLLQSCAQHSRHLVQSCTGKQSPSSMVQVVAGLQAAHHT